jgi:integrase
MPRRKPNSVYRTREHLTGAEVDRLIDAAKANRWGHRDATMILVGFRHGLRSSELVDRRWDQIDFTHAVLHVRRAKKGTPATPKAVARAAESRLRGGQVCAGIEPKRIHGPR